MKGSNKILSKSYIKDENCRNDISGYYYNFK